MIDRMRQAISEFLPLQVAEVDYNDPMVVLAGPGWSLSVACPWRLMKDDRLVTSFGDDGAEENLETLVGSEVVALRSVDCTRTPGDIHVAFADGTVLDVFADTDLDPWVLRLPDRTFVGSASCG